MTTAQSEPLATIGEEGLAEHHPARAFVVVYGIRLALLGLVLVAFGWRLHGLTFQSLWRDEIDAVYFALRALRETLAMIVQPAQNGPLFFLALRPWFVLAGVGDFTLRFPSVSAGTLAVPLAWQVARRLAPSRAQESDAESEAAPSLNQLQPIALLTALFIAFNPYQLWYGQEGKMYTVITALALLASWLWLQGIAHGGWKIWLGYLVTVTVAMYTHLLMVLIFPVHLLWMIIAWPQSKRHWFGYLFALACLTLPYIPFIEWHWAMLVRDEKWTGFGYTPLDQALRTLLFNHTRGFMPPGDLIWMAPIFFLGLAGLVMGVTAIGKRDAPTSPMLAPWRRLSMVFVWLFVPVLTIQLFSLRQPIFTDRYVIWIAPAAMILLALGVVVVAQNAGRAGKPLAVLLVIYLLGFWLYAGWQQKTLDTKYDLRGGVNHVAERRSPDQLLILQIPHTQFAYRYYTDKSGAQPFVDSEPRLTPWQEGLWTNDGLPDEQVRGDVDRQMQAMTIGYDEVWLLRSEVEMWDQRRFMDAWLDEHGEVVDQADFHGVQVRLYRLDE